MKWVLSAVAMSTLPNCAPTAQRGQQPPDLAHRPTVGPMKPADPSPGHPVAKGYGTDPNLIDPHAPGEFWPLTFTDAQKRAATALADTILPADHLGPAASAVGVVPMIDEWVSAPYPTQQADRPILLDGLAWLDAESTKRFQKPFADLSKDQRHNICDDICYVPNAKPNFKKPAAFFTRFRDLAAAAYYATPQGWKAIGYEGNVPLKTFDGPPPEVLAKLGVTQTVK